MDAVNGRHRRGGVRGLVTTGILIALSAGFLGGLGTGRYLLAGGDGGTSASTSAPSSAPASGSTSTPSPTGASSSVTAPPGSLSPGGGPPDATASPAPADPAPPGPQGAEAYLARLADNGLPVEQHRDVILVLGRVVCEATPSERADYQAMADRVIAIGGDLLSREQTLVLVQLAAQELCGS